MAAQWIHPQGAALDALNERYARLLERLTGALRRAAEVVQCLATRDDAVQEGLALAWRLVCRRPDRMDVLERCTGGAARILFRSWRAGRGVAGGERATDVLSVVAYKLGRVRVQRLATGGEAGAAETHSLLVFRVGADPAEIAALKIDFADWIRSLPRRRRRIALRLAKGYGTVETAERFGVSPGRISQLRSDLCEDWALFTS